MGKLQIFDLSFSIGKVKLAIINISINFQHFHNASWSIEAFAAYESKALSDEKVKPSNT